MQETDDQTDSPFKQLDSSHQVTMCKSIGTHDLTDDQIETLEDIARLFEDRLESRAQSMREE